MDPDANLTEQLTLAIKIIVDQDSPRGIDPDDALRLAQLIEALDEWIRRGGFPPSAWAPSAK